MLYDAIVVVIVGRNAVNERVLVEMEAGDTRQKSLIDSQLRYQLPQVT